jgi:hypothetical protein
VALAVGFGRAQAEMLGLVICMLEAGFHSSHACWGFGGGSAIGTSCRATNLVSVVLLEGAGLFEAKVLGMRVGGLEARSNGNTQMGNSGATMWKIVSAETIFKGGEHHTRGTGREGNDERVLATADADTATNTANAATAESTTGHTDTTAANAAVAKNAKANAATPKPPLPKLPMLPATNANAATPPFRNQCRQ